MATENVVKEPAASPTPPVNNPPLPSGSPAAPVSPEVGGVKPDPTPAAPATGAGQKPDAKMVPLEALHEERTKRQAMETKMAQMESMFGGQYRMEGDRIVPNQPVQPPPQQSSGDAEMTAKLEKLWDEDPKQAVRTEQMLALQWYDNLQSAVEAQKEDIKSKYQDFATYESEINKYVKRLPLAQRAQNGAIELAYLVVKGQNSRGSEEAIKKAAYDEFVRKMAAGEAIQGVPAGSFSQPPASPSNQPTDAQAAAAGAMGLTVEEYMSGIKR